MDKYQALKLLKESGVKLVKESVPSFEKMNWGESSVIKNVGLPEFKKERNLFKKLVSTFSNELDAKLECYLHDGKYGYYLTFFQEKQRILKIKFDSWWHGKPREQEDGRVVEILKIFNKPAFRTEVVLINGKEEENTENIDFDELFDIAENAIKERMAVPEAGPKKNKRQLFVDGVWKSVEGKLTRDQLDDMFYYKKELNDLASSLYREGVDQDKAADAIINRWSELTDY